MKRKECKGRKGLYTWNDKMTPSIDWKVVHNNIISRASSIKAILKDQFKITMNKSE